MTKEEIGKLVAKGSFPQSCLDPEIVETHISWVILCDEYVFKIKKPILYSFLDFSTLEKRRFFCGQEVELNRRLAPEVYVDVLPIFERNALFSIGGTEGQVVDYAVWMRRMDGQRQMSVLLKEDKVSKKDIQRLAEEVALFHQDATVIHEKDVFDVQQKFNDLDDERSFVKERLGDAAYRAITKAIKVSDAFIDGHHHLLRSRLQAGCYRDCHGDLHSRNIFLLDRPVIFDCIEFNDDYRYVDVLNDVAFLCMDLDAYQRHDLSDYFMQVYTTIFPCMKVAEEKKLFIYYKAYRANVRAKVNCLRAKAGSDPTLTKSSLAEAMRYLQLMKGYIDLLS